MTQDDDVMDAMKTAYWTDPDHKNPFPVGTRQHRLFDRWFDTYYTEKERENEFDSI